MSITGIDYYLSRRKEYNMTEDNSLNNQLIEKSKEAFSLAIELYNKPTITYRVEGFAFFICNAWELMLKAYMIKKFGDDSIYYVNNPERTLSLENCVSKVFTNEKSPIRLNLSKIIELRNISTHFIVQEFEMIYVPLFQACVLNYVEKMQEFHDVDMTKTIPQNFLTLAVSMTALDDEKIRAKYPEEIAKKIIDIESDISPMIIDNNNGFAIKIEHLHYITKNKSEATSLVGIDNNAETNIKIVKELKDPNNTHKYTMKSAIKEIDQRLRRAEIDFKMNQYVFNLFNVVYGIKDNEKYCYIHRQYAQPSFTYSIHAVELIYSEIVKDPENIVNRLKKKVKK